MLQSNKQGKKFIIIVGGNLKKFLTIPKKSLIFTLMNTSEAF